MIFVNNEINISFIVFQIGRLPGMESSHLHLEVFCGTDEDIAIEDVFHHPSPWEEGVQNSRCNDTA